MRLGRVAAVDLSTHRHVRWYFHRSLGLRTGVKMRQDSRAALRHAEFGRCWCRRKGRLCNLAELTRSILTAPAARLYPHKVQRLPASPAMAPTAASCSNWKHMQDRTILRAALRVLMNLEYRTAVDPADIDLLKSSALPDEIALDLDDLANRVALRVMPRPHAYAAS